MSKRFIAAVKNHGPVVLDLVANLASLAVSFAQVVELWARLRGDLS